MAIENDIKQHGQYMQMKFVEFLEFFARIAETMFKDDPEIKNYSLAHKIELLMDQTFEYVGQRRKQI